jgi:hypothetical protein
MHVPRWRQRLIALCANARGFALASEAIAHLAFRTEGVALAFTALLRSAFAAIQRASWRAAACAQAKAARAHTLTELWVALSVRRAHSKTLTAAQL